MLILTAVSPASPLPPSIDAPSLRERLGGEDPPVVLDVRTAPERAIARLPGDLWIPMQEIAARVEELDPARDVVVYCHVGARSARVAQFLRARGFARVANLVGGIDAWSAEVDPTVPRY